MPRAALALRPRAPALSRPTQALPLCLLGHSCDVQDAWLGSAMWRFLGQLPVNLFALNRGWGTLYFDTDGLRLPPTVVVWHNRRPRHPGPRIGIPWERPDLLGGEPRLLADLRSSPDPEFVGVGGSGEATLNNVTTGKVTLQREKKSLQHD